MQSLAHALTSTFLEDAAAIAVGAVRLLADIVRDAVREVRAAVFAPLDDLARACDVAGVLERRRLTRAETLAMRRRAEPRVFPRFARLRHLT